MARVGAVLRVTVRTAGELLVTFSVVLVLFIVYQLYYTNVVGRQVMGDEVDTMRRKWTAQSPVAQAPVAQASPSPAPPPRVVTPPPAAGYVAILHIPRLGTGADDAGTPVLEGVGMDVLNKAAGHY